MVKNLLARARTLASTARVDVRLAAGMRIARVESAADAAAARITLEMAVAEIAGLPRKDHAALLDQARRTAAAVAPAMLADIPRPVEHGNRQFAAGTLLLIMLSHGHTAAACEWLLGWEDAWAFPFAFLGNLLVQTADEREKVSVLEKAVATWRTAPSAEFLPVFRIHWRSLPEEEARAVLRDIVQHAPEFPDPGVSAEFDEGRVQFSSGQQYALFEVLHVLRRLEPELAEQLISAHGELAAAALRYPNGWETMAEEQRRCPMEEAATCCGNIVLSGERENGLGLPQASWKDDFEPALSEALQSYRDDVDPEHPNEALKEFWPSTALFRNVLFAAGKRMGEDAAKFLDEIPDSDLRLLAGIELAAALAGLPALPGVQQQYRPGWNRFQGAGAKKGEWQRRWPAQRYRPDGGEIFGARVRCPQCTWVPVEEDRWSCRCYYRWNTFSTRGRCPRCSHQWEETLCISCGRFSCHGDWYAPS